MKIENIFYDHYFSNGVLYDNGKYKFNNVLIEIKC